MFHQSVRGVYCLRCGTRKVVRGNLEAARFYPLRGVLQALLGKPVFLQHRHSHACLECGLTWNEVDPLDLRANLRAHGLAAHAPRIMETARGERPDIPL